MSLTAPATPRLATDSDLPALGRTLARAFLDDPVAAWCCPRAALRPRMLERFYATRLGQVMETGDVWTEPGLAGAALWLPPGAWHTTAREDIEMLRSMLHPRLLGRLPLVLAGLKGVEGKHAEEPHWYLNVLATDPEAQGRGIGSALMKPVLDMCDEDGLGAYLESSKEANIAFYARHGFRVIREHDLPRGPRMWLMWRDPR